jgi:acetylornithine deacetylase/succinyl-diaminopimelate desuccinylase-like protein
MTHPSFCRTVVPPPRFPATLALLGAFAAAPGLAQVDLRAAVEQHVEHHQQAIVGELFELLALPNVAADRANIARNAEWLRAALGRRGFAAELLATPGNPLVFGERRVPGATATVLVYCQYDGQPVHPPAWSQADPFAPVLRAGRLEDGAEILADPLSRSRFEADWRVYARAASDAKGPIVAFLAALDALAAAGLEPTVNLRVIMDGEEEIGSPHLVAAIAAHREKLAADLMLVFDGPSHSSGRPTLIYGARGIATVQLTVYGPKSGVHSGNYGNWIPNPALRLAHLLASMKDDAGNVLVPGFEDPVVALTSEEEAMIAAVPVDEAHLLETFGVAAPERPGLGLQQAFQRPTLNVRGLASAFVGEGARTIIPDRAVAELDLRLVPETPAERQLALLREHVLRQGYHLVDADPDDATRAAHPRIARLAVTETAIEAFRTPPTLPLARRVSEALARSWGEPPVRIRTAGGTVPIAPFIDALGFPAILVPIVNFDNHQHEENENLRLGHLWRGVVTYAAVLRM